MGTSFNPNGNSIMHGGRIKMKNRFFRLGKEIDIEFC